MRWWHLPSVLLALPGWRTEPVAAQAPAAPEVAQVRAAGTARRGLRPDLATLTVQFSAIGKTPIVAGRLVAMRADSLRRAFSASGIPLDSLISGSRWYWWRGRIEATTSSRYEARQVTSASPVTSVQIIDTVYRAFDAIEVRIHDLSRVGSVIDSALAHAVTDISNVRFSATPTPAVQEAITREATAIAIRQAQAMASASGMRLGRLLGLSTQPEVRYDRDVFASLSEAASAGNYDPGATTVVQPSIPISITVYGRWEVLP